MIGVDTVLDDEAVHVATDADVGELARLCELEVAELLTQRGGMSWWLRSGKQRPFIAQLRTVVHDPDAICLVGTFAGAPVGFATAHLSRLLDDTTWAVVDDLYVEPEARDMAVGEVLMDGVLAWAGERGCVAVDAIALPGMRASKNFFERFGLVARSIAVQRRLDGADLVDERVEPAEA
jgi:GNAT superfamily N-acetyltransferase